LRPLSDLGGWLVIPSTGPSVQFHYFITTNSWDS
jgi:hypothetical protein